MQYKLVAIDLDDTLLSDDLRISPQTIEAIREAVKRGVIVTLATGRMYQSAVQFAEEIGLDVPIITYQGAYVKNIFSKEVVYERRMPLESSITLINRLRASGKTFQIYLNDELYAEKYNQKVQKYCTVTKVNYHVVEDLIETITTLNVTPLKILVIDEPDEIKKMLKEYNELYNGEINITISKPTFLEFSHLEATKGQAIKHMAMQNGIAMEEVIAIGDSYNDRDMIELAGLGVCMENGNPDIQAIADYITKTNNDHGVYEVLQRFVLNR